MLTRLLLFGIFGWCAEIMWTAAYDLVESIEQRRPIDRRLVGKTYLWMLPIYGSGGLLFEVVFQAIAHWAWPVRGLVYMTGCFAIEYASGFAIKLATGSIPWDYSAHRFHVHGLIRLDYIPVWFAFGMSLEWVAGWIAAMAAAL